MQPEDAGLHVAERLMVLTLMIAQALADSGAGEMELLIRERGRLLTELDKLQVSDKALEKLRAVHAEETRLKEQMSALQTVLRRDLVRSYSERSGVRAYKCDRTSKMSPAIERRG